MNLEEVKSMKEKFDKSYDCNTQYIENGKQYKQACANNDKIQEKIDYAKKVISRIEGFNSFSSGLSGIEFVSYEMGKYLFEDEFDNHYCLSGTQIDKLNSAQVAIENIPSALRLCRVYTNN